MYNDHLKNQSVSRVNKTWYSFCRKCLEKVFNKLSIHS